MKLRTLSKIDWIFTYTNAIVILPLIIIGILLGYIRDGIEYICNILSINTQVGNKLLRISDEVKDGTIKNQDFIRIGTAKTAYKKLKEELKTNKKE